MRNYKVTAVIPAKNEETTIERVIKSLDFVDEIIVVNDGSSDNTLCILRQTDVTVINNPYNIGYDSSLSKGVDLAFKTANIVFTFDADGQHNADDAKSMVESMIEKDYDLVLGVRKSKPRLTEHVFAYFLKKINILDPLCGLKVYRHNVYESTGFFDNLQSIGTQLSIEASLRNFKICNHHITINKRKDTSRFGINIIANYKIGKSLCIILMNYWRRIHGYKKNHDK